MGTAVELSIAGFELYTNLCMDTELLGINLYAL